MKEKTVLKTLRLPEETFEELAAWAQKESRPFDALVADALQAWLEARREAALHDTLQAASEQTRFDYDEFWDGVEL
ncbi:hypothetical protein [Nitratifractor sp.]|uniref:hypothetical protein n=1 Tax=Nitratifractor sp. TaxID=2268144 RepID=UPI0025DACD9F|nr:hypothetical protein [Nitratifractor sp.]